MKSAKEQKMVQDAQKHFFISYTSTDRAWAEWIAWQLEEAGYTTVLQAWDFRPGSNFVLEMDKATQEAERTIAVLSPDYLNAPYAKAEWAAAFQHDPTGELGMLLPVHVRECRHQLKGLLGSIVYIDLVGLNDISAAHEMLLAGVLRERAKPLTPPGFPEGVQRSVAEQPRFPGTFPLSWNIPYQRNPFFTGREDILKDLYQSLRVGKTVAVVQPRVLSGLGGIGKTQTAVEYAYRYYSDYPAAILWARADSLEALRSEFVSIADLLRLPEKDEQDQRLTIAAVKRWLKEHSGWLLIFDNVEDVEAVQEYIPSAHRGHILLTARIQAMGFLAQRVEIEKMEPEEGALFLLRRANFIAPDAPLDEAHESDRATARDISQTMDGLPLALDQAGAYIEETQCSLLDYLNIYRTQRAILLQERGNPHSDHPASVSTTFSLSFEKVQQASPAAADMLKLFAFLAPESIPEEIVREGPSDLGAAVQSLVGNMLELNMAIKILLKFSLIHRDAQAHSFAIHRLVQAVLKDEMTWEEQQQWAECAVRAINYSFPSFDDKTWPDCQRYLPHALVCATSIEQRNITSPNAARLLHEAGSYLVSRALYVEAESLLKQALVINEQVLGPDHRSTASTLNNLASLYAERGNYEQAEPLFQRVLATREQVLGPDHPDTAMTLKNLALLYQRQDKYEQAELFYQRALAIRERVLRSDHPYVAGNLDDLACLYLGQGKYEQAEPLFQRALVIYEQVLGPDHLSTASTLNNLALLYQKQGKYEQAEPLFQRAVAIREKMLEPDHLETLDSLDTLANFYKTQGKNEQAEPLYQRTLAIRERVLGPDHPSTATNLNTLAILYQTQGKYEQAEPLYQRTLAIRERVLGPDHPSTADSFYNLALIYQTQGQNELAKPLYQRALAIYEQVFGPDHLPKATCLNNLAILYRSQGNYEQAEPL